VKASELIRLAKKNGCQIKKHGGEHDLWINSKTGGTARIPRHPSKEVAAGTADQIMKNLGLK
jgi:predicted RNA binding protein YcfA (HicA-like mRNA interferase family)